VAYKLTCDRRGDFASVSRGFDDDGDRDSRRLDRRKTHKPTVSQFVSSVFCAAGLACPVEALDSPRVRGRSAQHHLVQAPDQRIPKPVVGFDAVE